MRITICHRRWLKKRVDTSKTPLQLPSSENMVALCVIISFLLFHTLVCAGESCKQMKFRIRFCPCRSRLSVIFCWSFGVLLHVLYHATNLSKFKLQSCWQGLRHQILSTTPNIIEQSILWRNQHTFTPTTPTEVRFCFFFFSFIFFHGAVAENWTRAKLQPL